MHFWIFLGLGGLIFVAGLSRLLLGRARQFATRTDAFTLLALVPVALFSVSPYVGNNLVGAGDSYFYALQVADFITQLRQGVMPILAGQSDYAFNGNIYMLRTAPYFAHLAGALDLLTGRQLSFVTLQNLTVVTSALFAVWAAYLVACHASGGRRVAAALLATAYVTSPALIFPLALNDMFATYMAVPWLAVCWYALAGILRRENDLCPQLMAVGALALVWYAHAPIAAWLSLAWAAVQFIRLLRTGGSVRQWPQPLAAGLLLAGLVSFIPLSYATLGLGSVAATPPGLAFTVEDLHRALRQEFSPHLLAPGAAGIQLGWTLWVIGWGAVHVLWRRRHADGLLVAALLAVFMLFLFPFPWLSTRLWETLPARLAELSNWPAQRLCPLLASGIVVLGATALRQMNGHSATTYRVICAVLLAGCGWNCADLAILNHRQAALALAPPAQTALFSPDNLRLTRYSYALLGKPPAYFSHGWMDPEFESRLLDPAMEPGQDNPAFILASAGPSPAIPVSPVATLTLSGPGNYLVVFAFADPTVSGEISIKGDGIERSYGLPRSGGPLGFGAEPACSKTMPLRLRTNGSRQIVVSTNAAGVSLRAVPFQENSLPIRVSRQTPYTATVHATAAGFLETPRLYLDGYEAAVNGQRVRVRPSPDHLVLVPVPSGESQVTLTYPGPLILRAGWLLSLACFAAFPWILLKACAQSNPLATGPGSSSDRAGRQNILAGLTHLWLLHPRRVIAGSAAVLLGLGFAWTVHELWQERQAYGSLRLSLQFPRFPEQKAEPLLTLGKTGAADCIYVIYDDPGHVRFGLDHWSAGGPVSEPVPINHAIHAIEITTGGLYPASRWFKRSAPPGSNGAGLASFILKIDGRTVFLRPSPYYASRPAQVTIGENRVGASICSERFSGRILAAERFVSPEEKVHPAGTSTP